MNSDFDKELNNISSPEELEQLKHSLFMENVRLTSEKSQLQSDYEEIYRRRRELISEKHQLDHERKQLTLEISKLKEQVEYERKRLKDDEKLFDKKQKVIERAYELLDKDKKNISEEYEKVERLKSDLRRMRAQASKEVYATGLFFRGVNNMVALKKRYKDLLKIYHPDNICGDNEILLKINKEYEELRSKLDISKYS
ncbi:MAG: hypothetical protein K6F90_02160 [Lachnospiraceae bacterium]|nr:hypothetical protein [Lachnospiraceae bacterium]